MLRNILQKFPWLRASLMVRFVMMICVPLLLVCAVQAQILNVGDDTANPMPGGHDYIHLLSETVNPSNGTLNLNVSLPAVKGRGITLPFALIYNSGQVHHVTPQSDPGVQLASENGPSVGGWGNSLPILSLSAYTTTSVAPYDSQYLAVFHQPVTCNYTSGYMFNGHALNLAGVQYPAPGSEPAYYCESPTEGGSYSIYSKGGDEQFYATFPTTCSTPTIGCAANGHDPVNVYDKEGTTYSFTGGNWIYPVSGVAATNFPPSYYWPATVEDRNGNTIQVTRNANGILSAGVTLKDTLGRTAISTNDNAAPTTVTVGGLTYQITYTTISAQFSIGTQQVNALSQFSCSFITNVNDSQQAIQTITLPNQKQYHFYYGTDNQDPNFRNPYGLLSEIDYPDGGWVKYTWKLSDTLSEFTQFDGSQSNNYSARVSNACEYQYKTPVVATRQVGYGVSSTPALIQTFTYSTTWNSSNGGISWTQKITNVNSSDQVTGKSSLTVYTYGAIPVPLTPNTQCCSIGGQIPVENAVRYYDWGNTNTPIRTVNKTWQDQYSMTSQQTVLDNGQSSQINYNYTPAGRLIETDEFDFGQSTPSRKTLLSYQSYSTGPLAVFSDDVCQKIVTDGGGTHVAETDYFYDGETAVCGAAGTPSVTGVSGLIAGTHDETNYGSGSPVSRGNVTTKTVKCFTAATGAACPQGDSSARFSYDETGQVLTVTDARSDVTQYSYTDNFTEGTAPGVTNAYLTKVTDALNHTEQFQYGYDDGQLRTSTDENGNQSCYVYNDSLRRLRETDHYAGSAQCSGTLLAQTKLDYSDSAPSPSVKTTEAITATTSRTSVATMDGVGHVVKTQLTSDPQGTVTTDTVYDGFGRVYTTSNPYRSTSDTTYGITTMHYDALGRATQVTRQDGGTISTNYNGACTTAMDEIGNPRKSCSDGLGRLIEVDEPNAASLGISATASVTINSVTTNGALNSTSSTHPLLTASANTLASNVTPDGTQHFFYIGTNHHIYHGWNSGTGWQGQDVTTAANGTLATSGSALTGFYSGSSLEHLFFLDSNLHVHEMFSDSSHVWHDQDNTALAGGTAAASGSALTSFYTGGSSLEHLFFLDSNGHVHEMFSDSSNVWHNQDNTTLASGTAAATGSALTSFYSGGSAPEHLFFTASNGHVHEMYSDSSNVWHDQDNTAFASGTAAATGSALTSFYSGGSAPEHLFFTASNGHVHEMYSVNGQWYDQDNTAAAFGTAAASGSGLTSFYLGGSYPEHLFFVASNGHVHEMYSNSGHWYDQDNTTVANGTAAVTSSALTSFDAAGLEYVLFVDASGHVHDMYSNWHDQDIMTSGTTVVDSGTTSLTIGGFTANACYGNSTNPACTGQPVNTSASQLAATLAQIVNGPGSPATASISGSTTINLVWRTTGPFTASVSALNSTPDNPSLFPTPSFSSQATSLANGQGPPIDGTAYVTKYQYDTLGNLQCAHQKGSDTTADKSCTDPAVPATWRPRNFTYNSLSELLTAYNPETGNISYTYDANGNVITKTDARGITAIYSRPTDHPIDALNRVTEVTFSNNDPAIIYTYDLGANGIGHRTNMTDASGSTAWTYDPMGRVLTEQRTIAGIGNTIRYGYNMLSGISSITYPSGAVVTYTPDNAGRSLSAIDSVNGLNYAQNAKYSPDGKIASFLGGQSGLFGGYTSTYIYNSRLQICRELMSSTGVVPSSCMDTSNTGNILDYQYDFHLGNGDNGNLYQASNNRDPSRTQVYTYDPLNRLTSAQNGGVNFNNNTGCTVMALNGQTKFWGNSFTYDAWGNLLAKNQTRCSPDPLSASANSNNQLNGQYNYDVAGNMINNGPNAYIYDGESQMVSAGGYSYVYDGDGNRVEKTNGTTGTLYWYGAPGVVAETNLLGGMQSEYVFFNGARIARKDGTTLPYSVYYYFGNQIGSTSVIADSSGNLQDDSDYYAWGGQVQFSENVTNHYWFSGKERDTESGIDYFGARYYGNSMGRFLTPDPTGLSAVNRNSPQSWNLYTYALNNPLALVDPNGLYPCPPVLAARPGDDAGGDSGDCDDPNPPPPPPDIDPCQGNGDNCYQQEVNKAVENDAVGLALLARVYPPCNSALATAGANSAAVQRADSNWSLLQEAASANGIDPSFLAATGVRESGFQNIWGDHMHGRGLFQIDIQHGEVSNQQAFSPSFAANFAASMLSTNRDKLAERHPQLNEAQLNQATAASYNAGTGNISGNPRTIDVGTTGNNYGGNVMAIATNCFM
jgi:RHS repeat-associated protein